MPDILIRGIPDTVKDSLRRQAAAHGHSMEAEAREILARGVGESERPRVGLAAEMRRLLDEAGIDGAELEIPPRTDLPRPVDFG